MLTLATAAVVQSKPLYSTAPVVSYSSLYSPYNSAPAAYIYNQEPVNPMATYSNIPVSTYARFASPVYGYSGVGAPVAYSPPLAYSVPATHTTLTSYNNPEQYTAVNTGVHGIKHIAKNGPVEHVVVKRAAPVLNNLRRKTCWENGTKIPCPF